MYLVDLRNKKDIKIYFFDSYPNCFDSKTKCEEFKFQLTKKIPHCKINFLTVKSPHQNNGTDCGFWVMTFIVLSCMYLPNIDVFFYFIFYFLLNQLVTNKHFEILGAK